MKKLTLTYVKRYNKTSVRTEKPYVSLSIKSKEYGDQFLSGFGSKENGNWKEGDVVEVAEVTEKISNGKTYLNFEMPKVERGAPSASREGQILTTLGKIDYKLDRIMDHLSAKQRLDRTSDGSKMPNFAPDDAPEHSEEEYLGM